MREGGRSAGAEWKGGGEVVGMAARDLDTELLARIDNSTRRAGAGTRQQLTAAATRLRRSRRVCTKWRAAVAATLAALMMGP